MIRRNYAKYIITIALLAVSIWITMHLMKKFLAYPKGKLLAALTLVLWALFILHYLSPFFSSIWAKLNPFPNTRKKIRPDLSSKIRDLILAGNFAEAIKKLNAILKNNPHQPETLLTLVEIYENNLDNSRLAVDLIEAYFLQEKVFADKENIEILLLYANICEKKKLFGKIQRLLEHEAKRKGYSGIDRERLLARLNAVEKM